MSGAVTFSRSLLLLSRSLPMGRPDTRCSCTNGMYTVFPTYEYMPLFEACQSAMSNRAIAFANG